MGISGLGTLLVLFAVLAAVFGGAIYLGIRTARKTEKQWMGWVIGIGAFIILCLVFKPAIDALNRESCRGSGDVAECMHPS